MDNREREEIIKASFYMALTGQSGVLSPNAIVDKAKEVARLAPEALAEILKEENAITQTPTTP